MNPDTHLYLYAKGHYAESDVINDVRRLVAERAHIQFREVSQGTARQVLTSVAVKEMKRSGNMEYLFPKFVRWVAESTMPKEEAVFHALLGILFESDARGLDLGEASASVLPLKEMVKSHG